MYVTENVTSITQNVGATNFPVVAHSLYVAVVGGTNADVAQAIWNKKNDGSNYNGNTTVVVTDQSGYSYPYPSYDVTFERPDPTPIKFAVSLVDNPALPANIQPLVRNAIIAAFVGGDGGTRARIGATVFASRYYAAVSAIGPWVDIISILIGKVTANLNSVPIGIDEAPTVVAGWRRCTAEFASRRLWYRAG